MYGWDRKDDAALVVLAGAVITVAVVIGLLLGWAFL